MLRHTIDSPCHILTPYIEQQCFNVAGISIPSLPQEENFSQSGPYSPRIISHRLPEEMLAISRLTLNRIRSGITKAPPDPTRQSHT
jgi:hypothetical protein